jgi:hypothetical protein
VPEEILQQDKAFYQSLEDYLSQFSEGLKPLVPVFFKTDGTIDRAKTLDSPCFLNSGITAE